MAWVRIHDGAMSHPKLVDLIDWRNPFCVWVWGLSYCQLHLTNGAIPRGAVPNPIALKTSARLVAAHMWEMTDSGFHVHDYLDWNDSRELVSRKRSDARERMTNARQRSSREQRENFYVDRGVKEVSSQEKGSGEKPSRAGVFAGALPRDHATHAHCDPTFSRCVPSAVQNKLSALLSPRFAGDVDAARLALEAWYPTVWAALPAEFVMGDAFRFWQSRFDEKFATVERRAAPRQPAGPPLSDAWTCPHTPPCTEGRFRCAQRDELEEAKREVAAEKAKAS